MFLIEVMIVLWSGNKVGKNWGVCGKVVRRNGS